MSERGDRAALLPRGRVLLLDIALLGLALVVDMMILDGDRQFRNGEEVPEWLIPASAAVVFATLLVRRRVPIAVFLIQIAYATLGAAFMPGYNTIPGVLIALHMVAAKRSPGASVLALVACAIPFGLQALNTVVWYGGNMLTSLVVLGTLNAIPPTTAWGVGYRTWLAERRSTELETRQATEIDQALRLERLRVAHELHDILAHSVSVMVLQAAGGRAIIDSDPVRATEVLTVIEDVGTQSMAELRRLLGLLRSVDGSDGLEERGWERSITDIDEIIKNARGAGITVTESVEGVVRQLDRSVSLTAYRVVQEALTNTIKYGGPGSTANIKFIWLGDHLEVMIEDRSVRPLERRRHAAVSMGYGLLGLRERVNTVGGSFEASPVLGGFIVRADLPTADKWASGAPAASAS
jgi:signal transduction histidine kinase